MESLATRYAAVAAAGPHRRAIVVGDHRVTRAEVDREAARVADVLTGLGVRRGDRVGLVRRNAALHITALLACTRIGAILVPLNFRLPALEAARIIHDCTPTVVLCGPRHAEQFDTALTAFPPTRWVVDDRDPAAGQPVPDLADRWHRLSDLLTATASGIAPQVEAEVEDIVMLQYTSGSTGRPKGVQLTYRNLAGSWENFDDTIPISEDDVALGAAPFGHVGGLNSFTLQSVMAGGCVVVQRQFDCAQALAHIEQYRVTRMFGVPAMYAELSRHPDFTRRDLSSLRVLIAGGAPVPQLLVDVYRDRGIPLWVSWGMTETCGGATMLTPDDGVQHPRSVGRPSPRSEIRLVDPETLVDLRTRATVGEIIVRGDNVSAGYWGDAASNDVSHLADGWLRTGDLAMSDAEGFLYLAGRSKDIIISGGENIHPVEIEEQLRDLPDVRDVAVIGIPDARWGETPLVYVVPADQTAPPTLAEIREFLTPRLARYKLPRFLTVVPRLPLAATGKVDRASLRRMAIADSPR